LFGGGLLATGGCFVLNCRDWYDDDRGLAAILGGLSLLLLFWFFVCPIGSFPLLLLVVDGPRISSYLENRPRSGSANRETNFPIALGNGEVCCFFVPLEG
jgi:hypothetical protein